MVRTTYALAYEVKEDAFSLEQEIVRPTMESRSPFTDTLPKISEGSSCGWSASSAAQLDRLHFAGAAKFVTLVVIRVKTRSSLPQALESAYAPSI
jgi:hypothetical protein